ncbi:NrfD/PsrC family molybdoenzyme membrane anchor subunit [Oceanimonas sp. CHS3-5]|uniref:NrfD/PsrC family molybdoenzyme membrane anchor subunit n=1 Tax=Oceanimonas sp. CHS3-5 TaxID=3068186 RepID=UPI00274014E8|nr:NrfD/PsrC family molybdoenzyme membrane anchor subunit [Oceanimonas sp. CHS3-5]MDP5290964.1 NrfD/PsrC family molybdoenzyme membrane anchor subunit [Oceanimonas sp. CHS3-5]
MIELLTTHAEAPWLPWAVQYFFFIGIAACAALLLPLSLNANSAWHPWRDRLALVLGISALVGPVALLADLHQPARFWHFYTQLTPSSWMWLGALILPVFVTLSLVVTINLLRTHLEFKQPWINRWLNLPFWPQGRMLSMLAWLCALSALGILLYTGMEIMVVRSRALWHTAWLPVNLLLTALLALTGLLMLLECLFPRQQNAALLRRTMIAVLAALTVTVLLWAITGQWQNGDSWREAQRLFTNFPFWRHLMLLSVASGMALWWIAALRLNRPLSTLDLLPASLAMLCAWGFRWVVLMNVQTVPKYGAGLYHLDPQLLSSAGVIVAGTLGLWLALAGAVWALLDNSGVRHG